MIPNNSTFTSLYPLIHRYAIMLAHVEVTFVATLVDVRDNGGIPMASTEAARQSYKNYINNKAQGKFGAVVDPAFSTLKFIDTSRTSSTSLKDYVEIRKNLLHDFYEDIGVKTSWSKKGNMIEAEVQANDAMLLINLNDMVDSRKRAAEKINKMFGLNWSVDIAEELKYNDVDNVTDNNDKEDEDNETENSSND